MMYVSDSICPIQRLRSCIARMALLLFCTIAVLNPLLCVLHCSIVYQRDASFANAPLRFICDLHIAYSDAEPVATSLQLPVIPTPSIPVAVYEGYLMLAFLMAVLAIAHRLVQTEEACTYSLSLPPPTPPPKMS